MQFPIERRTFLRAGGVVLALPMLEAMTPRCHASLAKKPIKRL